MIVTAWNNGAHHPTGGGYGFKIDAKDREEHFKKHWKDVILELEGEKKQVEANVEKKSFWDPECGELIKKEIGVWLIKNRKAPWPEGNPPKMRMEHINDNKFKVEFI